VSKPGTAQSAGGIRACCIPGSRTAVCPLKCSTTSSGCSFAHWSPSTPCTPNSKQQGQQHVRHLDSCGFITKLLRITQGLWRQVKRRLGRECGGGLRKTKPCVCVCRAACCYTQRSIGSAGAPCCAAASPHSHAYTVLRHPGTNGSTRAHTAQLLHAPGVASVMLVHISACWHCCWHHCPATARPRPAAQILSDVPCCTALSCAVTAVLRCIAFVLCCAALH
jgi:hypothetical protein